MGVQSLCFWSHAIICTKYKVFDVSTILFLSGSQYIKPKTYLKRETFFNMWLQKHIHKEGFMEEKMWKLCQKSTYPTMNKFPDVWNPSDSMADDVYWNIHIVICYTWGDM